MFATLASGAPACVCVTLLDGLVLARSAMHHSMNYRFVVIFGAGVDEASAKVRAGPPIDADADLDLPVWAGVLPLRDAAGPAESDAIAAGKHEIPAHVATWFRG